MSNDFLSELEKIADTIEGVAPDDVGDEQMVPDTAPHVDPQTVEAVQTANAEVPPAADEQLPADPQADKELAEAIGQAQQEYEAVQEQLAALEFEYSEMEKTASDINSQLPAMAALARLIDFSTNQSISEDLQKLASDRLSVAMGSIEGYEEMLQKTAQELFEDEENLSQLYSPEGKAYVLERLASFYDEDLEKIALEVGGILSHAQDIVGDYIHGARNLWKLEDQIKAAKIAVDAAKEVADQKIDMVNNVRSIPHPSEEAVQASADKAHAEYNQATADWRNERDNYDNLVKTKQRGQQVWFGGGALGAGGAFLGGKAIANAANSHDEPEKDLYEKSASVTMNLENNDDIKGGTSTMASVVKDFLKIAGAAGLLELANNEDVSMELRKEAAESFNAIARMSRYDMEQSFEKMATQIYTEPELHEIVAGKHNEYLFDKIAYFTELEKLNADELEKVAGADGVAAKGVAGALTDAKSNIEEKVKGDKEHTEEVKNGELGTRKPDDMRGYNVINNPAAYKVDKTAGIDSILEEAQLRKEAAYRAFVEADTFIKLNS